jgi:hypothetical protein
MLPVPNGVSASIEVTTLDEAANVLKRDCIDLLKLDVEGS